MANENKNLTGNNKKFSAHFEKGCDIRLEVDGYAGEDLDRLANMINSIADAAMDLNSNECMLVSVFPDCDGCDGCDGDPDDDGDGCDDDDDSDEDDDSDPDGDDDDGGDPDGSEPPTGRAAASPI